MANKLFLFLCLLVFISCEIPIFQVNTETNSNNAFTVKKGQRFKLKLFGNPSTGYSWFLLNLENLTSSKFVSNVDTNEDGTAGGYVPFVSQKTSGFGFGLVGAGGDFYYTFKAVDKTTEPVELLFSYQRPWEKVNDDSNAISVKITVE